MLVSAVFVTIGLRMVASPESIDRPAVLTLFWGWFGVIFFGATGLVGLCSLLRPTQLILTRAGFQVHGLRLKPLVPWNAVERFFISKVKSTKFVSYTLKTSVNSPVQRAAALVTSSDRADGRIPPYLERGADEVGALLEEWRLQYSVVD